MHGMVIAHVVTFNSSSTIERCLLSLLQQEELYLDSNYEVWVTDNNSTDDTVQRIKSSFGDEVRLKINETNMGFSHAHNDGISHAINYGAEYVFVVNPDLWLERDCLWKLVTTVYDDPRAGFACPKLYRTNEKLEPMSPRTLDSTGLFFTRTLRHFDRGSNETDYGQYDDPEYVFGASGAAVLFKRDFILDASYIHGGYYELFDDAFFAYREDADLAWRAQIAGWKCRYEPRAIGYHRRVVFPSNRRLVAKELNRYSVRNRFLMQIKNFSIRANWRCLPLSLLRNFIVILGVIFWERSSLPGLFEVIKNFKGTYQKRILGWQKQRVSYKTLGRWFRRNPKGEPLLVEARIPEIIRTLGIIIINYNSGRRLATCLNDLEAVDKKLRQTLDHKFIIVDNASADDQVAPLYEKYKDNDSFHFEILKENLGFAGGINYATRLYHADAYLVLNPDIRINASEIIKLLKVIEKFQNVGAVSPILVNTLDEVEFNYTARRFPQIDSLLAELFFLHRLFPDNPWTKEYHYKDSTFLDDYVYGRVIELSTPYEHRERPIVVNQPAAACLMIRGDAMRESGGFDERYYPAWFEDVDFCFWLRKFGYLATITRDAKAIHEGGYSKDVIGMADFTFYYYRNLIRYMKSHYKLRYYLPFRLAFMAAMALRLVVNGIPHDLALLTKKVNNPRHKKLLTFTYLRLMIYRLSSRPKYKKQSLKINDEY